jgi:hypothetical protein
MKFIIKRYHSRDVEGQKFVVRTVNKVHLLGLRKVRALEASNFLVKCDAEVIKEHIKKESEAREPELIKYLAEVRRMERHF